MAEPFVAFPKIPRWSRDIVITEKIDGTNGSIWIPDFAPYTCESGRVVPFLVGSRNRWIFPENDNFGFAKWAYANVDALLRLGPGHHFGEWWGAGIQRRYGLLEKRFSLFNVGRFNPEKLAQLNAGLEKPIFHAVPKLYEGPNDQVAILMALGNLALGGSLASPGFMDPEGIVIFHTASGGLFKKTLKDDETFKGAKVGG